MRFTAIILCALAGLLSPSAEARSPVVTPISVCFIPAEQDCFTQIVAAIDAARREIRVQAYGFTAPDVIGALVEAKQRGVDVQIVLDKSDERQRSDSGAIAMARVGVPVWIDRRAAIAHNKVIIIDDHLVISGSANYTRAAGSRNAENVMFTWSPEVAGWFLENWASRRAASSPYLPGE